jgi:hypothetical protein
LRDLAADRENPVAEVVVERIRDDPSQFLIKAAPSRELAPGRYLSRIDLIGTTSDGKTIRLNGLPFSAIIVPNLQIQPRTLMLVGRNSGTVHLTPMPGFRLLRAEAAEEARLWPTERLQLELMSTSEEAFVYRVTTPENVVSLKTTCLRFTSYFKGRNQLSVVRVPVR